MRCEEISEYLADHLTGALDPAAEAEFTQHLMECEECRIEFEDLKAIWSDLDHVPVPQPDSAAMRSRFMAALNNPQQPYRRFTMRQAAKPISVIALLIALATGATMFFSRCGLALACPGGHGEVVPAGEELSKTPVDLQSHVRGSSTATVSLVEYGDFECPPCGTYEPVVRKVLERFEGKVSLEFRHFPLSAIHPNAVLAATAAEAAGDQDHFWEMHDLLFQMQSKWKNAPDAERQFIDMAGQFGLDKEKFEKSLRDPQIRSRVEKQADMGRSLGVQATPTFILNGKVLESMSPTVEAFAEEIERALKKSER